MGERTRTQTPGPQHFPPAGADLGYSSTGSYWIQNLNLTCRGRLAQLTLQWSSLAAQSDYPAAQAPGSPSHGCRSSVEENHPRSVP